MNSKYSLFLFFTCLALVYSSTWLFDSINTVIDGSCQSDLRMCMEDQQCAEAIYCMKDCDRTNNACHNTCFDRGVGNSQFFTVYLCGANSLIEKDQTPEFLEKTQNCMKSECSMGACGKDDFCVFTAFCIDNCNAHDYQCEGKCLADAGESEATLSLVKCIDRCI